MTDQMADEGHAPLTGQIRARFSSRMLARLGIDSVAWAIGVTLAALLRVDFEVAKLSVTGQVAIVPLAAICQFVAGLSQGIYTGRWWFGSFDEVAALARSVVLATAGLFALDYLVADPRLVPLSSVLGGGIIALVVMGGVRYLWRLRQEQSMRPSADAARVIVFGAGNAGQRIVASMQRDPTSRLRPVAMLDDDPSKRNLRVSGVSVRGTRDDLAAVASAVEASVLLLAIPSAGRELVGRVADEAQQVGLTVKVLPPLSELIDGSLGAGDIRDLSPADLLGRHEVETNLDEIAHYLADKRVLVTGAGGSIGSELCRQIHAFGPSALIMVDRDESALHAVQLSIEGRALLDSDALVLADIRDPARLEEVFERWSPEVVFHAAALKHLPLLERYPVEGVKTNVVATLILLELAAAHGVERFVNVSTDKAADPTSVLGYTKRIAERLTAHVAQTSSGAFLSVRFGNVLGSRGSMLDTFTRQIADGGPITVTDPEVERFFMTVSEAVQLVIQAGAIGRDGEVLVLDMGAPVRIAEVARRLAAQVSDPVDVVFTGLRPGEKLTEVLFASGEVDHRPCHPLIAHCDVPPLTPAAVETLPAGGSSIVEALRLLAEAGVDDDALPTP